MIVTHSKTNKTFLVNIIGTAAAIISAVSLLPQLFDVYKTGIVEGISIGTLLLILSTSLLWFTYHMMMGTYHGSVASSFNILFSSILIGYVITIRNKDDNDDERLPLSKK